MHRHDINLGSEYPFINFSEYPKIYPAGTVELHQYTNYIRYQSGIDFGTASCAKRSDGKIAVTYWDITNDIVKISCIDEARILFTIDNCCDNINEYDFCTINPGSSKFNKDRCMTRSKLFRNALNELLLFIYDPGYGNQPSFCRVYKSTSGNGENISDWNLYSTIWDVPSPALSIPSYSFNQVLNDISPLHYLTSGRLCFMVGKWVKVTNYIVSGYYYCYSDDDGLTWSFSEIYRPSYGSSTNCPEINGVCESTNCIYLMVGSGQYLTHTRQFIIYSINNGLTWSLGNELDFVPGTVLTPSYHQDDTYNYYMKTTVDPQYNLYYMNKNISLDLINQEPYKTNQWVQSNVSPVIYNNNSHNNHIQIQDGYSLIYAHSATAGSDSKA